MIIRFSKESSDQITIIKGVHYCAPIFNDENNFIGFKLICEKKDGELDTLYLRKDIDFDCDQIEVIKNEDVPCLFQLQNQIEHFGINPKDFESPSDFIQALKVAVEAEESFSNGFIPTDIN